jgi:hypothetical protein
LDTDEQFEHGSARHNIATEGIQREPKRLAEFGFNECDLLIGPTGIAPVALACGVAVVGYPHTGDELHRCAGPHRLASGTGDE